METSPYQAEYLHQAASLFIDGFKKQRLAIPILPDLMQDVSVVSEMLAGLFSRCPGVFALQEGRLVGYMGWYVIDRFRDTPRRAAYCPEWAHAVSTPDVYPSLYRAASSQWAEAGCDSHAISLLACDEASQKSWFWNGFGLTVVDAVRPMTPLAVEQPAGFVLRRAAPEDAADLAVLEAEHWRHYFEAPVFMTPSPPYNTGGFVEFLKTGRNSAYMAYETRAGSSEPAAYMRFEASGHGAADIVNSDKTIAITGAFTRPAYRGKRLAAAILNRALVDYAAQGYTRCAVDFESFNPEAAAFWMRYFEPVVLSVMRVPER